MLARPKRKLGITSKSFGFHCNHYDNNDAQGDMQRTWLSQTEDLEKWSFTGLRLQCSNVVCTFLTPGFFPRLQVMLYSYYLEKGWIGPGKQEPRVEMDVDLFAITTLGFDVLVEYSGSLGFYVDIMVRSIRHPLQTTEFVHNHVVKPIRLFCASQEGCMGVDLEEHVLRHECVKHLTIRRYRKDQSVRTVDLMSKVEEANGDYYIQTWPRVAEDGMPDVCVLETRNEFATTVQGRVILGSEHDVNWASSSYVPQVLEDCYPDTNVKCGKRRGVAVLISMEKYKNRPRRGDAVDREKLEELAGSLKLDLVKFVDVSAGTLETELWKTARTGITEDDECLVCFVSGHGSTFNDGAFFLTDTEGNWIFFLDNIVKPFQKCKNLMGKPKIFFVTACRGNVKLGGMSETKAGWQPHASLQDQTLQLRFHTS